jgi:hypothetical protein
MVRLHFTFRNGGKIRRENRPMPRSAHSEPVGRETTESPLNFFFGVHQEPTAENDGFAERWPAEQE